MTIITQNDISMGVFSKSWLNPLKSEQPYMATSLTLITIVCFVGFKP